MAKARWTASSVQNSTAIQNRPGGGPGEDAAVGVEGEREQDQHEQRRTGAIWLVATRDRALDAQVLAGDQRGVTEHGARLGGGDRRVARRLRPGRRRW